MVETPCRDREPTIDHSQANIASACRVDQIVYQAVNRNHVCFSTSITIRSALYPSANFPQSVLP